MLEERQYVREELPRSVSESEVAELQRVFVLGDALLSTRWAHAAVFVLHEYFQRLPRSPSSSSAETQRSIASHATLLSLLQCIHIFAAQDQEGGRGPRFYREGGDGLRSLLKAIEVSLATDESLAEVVKEAREISLLL